MITRFTSLFLLLLSFGVNAQSQTFKKHKQDAIRFFKNSVYDSSAYHYERAISLCGSCPDTLKAILNLSLYKTYKYDERFEDAYLQLTKAEFHSKKAKSNEHLAMTYIAFAEHFRSNRNLKKAEIYLNIVEEIISRGKISDATLGSYYNRKAAILSEGQFNNEGAIYYSLKNIEIAKKIHDKDLEAISLNEIGFAYEKMNQFEKSVSYYVRAIEIWKNLEEGISLANALGNLVRVYIKNNEYDQALKFNTMGYELSKNKKYSYWFAVFTYQQYEIYRHQNKLIKALETLEEYVILNEEYSKKQWVNAISKAENIYENKQKDNELKLIRLQLKNRELELIKKKQDRIYTIIAISMITLLLIVILIYTIQTKRTNKKLQSLVKENQFLLGESNHRIKNNLQLIIALIYQEIEKEKSDLEQSSLFEIVEKIESVSALHKQLYTLDKKQMIQLKSYLSDIQTNFSTFFLKRDIQVNFDIDDLEMDINQSLYFGILTTELILNSLKHAFNYPDKERWISLSLKSENGKIRFQYADSGPGLKTVDTQMKLVHLMSQQMRFKYKILEKNHFSFEAILDGKI